MATVKSGLSLSITLAINSQRILCSRNSFPPTTTLDVLRRAILLGLSDVGNKVFRAGPPRMLIRYRVQIPAKVNKVNCRAVDCRNGRRKFDIVLVWALDRLSREGAASILNLVDSFKALGVNIDSGGGATIAGVTAYLSGPRYTGQSAI